MSLKLLSSDKKIVLVNLNVIKQMVTIQTMLENLGDDDTNNDEPIPLYRVNGETLGKVIEWTKYHIKTTDKSIRRAWGDQFFTTNLENVFQLVTAADYLEVDSLLVDGQVFIDRSFGLIKTTESFKDLSPEKLRVLLARETLNVPSEEVVFESLETWISADPEERSLSLADLIPCIRASFLPSHFIDDVKNFLVKHRQPNLGQQLNYDIQTPRHGYDRCIFVVHEKRVDGRCLKYLDLYSKTWTHLTDIPDEDSRDSFKVCCVEGNIYLVGGYSDGLDKRVTEYNPRTNTWRNMPSLMEGRVGHSVCTLDNKIFVLGGTGGGGTTCEMLNLGDDDPQWRYISDMNRDHYGGGAVVIERKIYVLSARTTNVEMYDVDVDQGRSSWFHKFFALIGLTNQQDQWRIVTNMPTKRSHPGVAALDKKIYVAGGSVGHQPMSSVDCYDLDTNTWSQVANMNIARDDHSLLSLHGRLYAIGGFRGMEYVDRVEAYDPDNNKWTLLQHKLDGEVLGARAGLVTNVNK